jgi:tyrosine-protein kinase Etk/Wzc
VSATPINGMQSNDADEISWLDVALVLRQNLMILLVFPVVAGLLALAVSFLITPAFMASAKIMPPQQQQSTAAALLGSLGGLAGAAGAAGLKNPADQWIGLLKSRTIADAMVARFDLRTRYDSEFQFQARNALAGSTSINAGKDSLITIEVIDKDPKMAAEMADAYVEELQKISKTLAVSEAAQRRLFFEGQLNDAKKNLVEAETTLRASGVNASILKTNPEAAVGAIAQIKAQIASAEVQLSVMRGYLNSGSSEMQRALTELSSLRAQLTKADQKDSAADAASGSDYVGKYRNFKYYETLFELMARQYELAKADEAKDGALIQVVDAAQIPEWKTSPKRGVIAALTTVLALILAIAYVLARQSLMSAALKNPDFAAKLSALRLGKIK